MKKILLAIAALLAALVILVFIFREPLKQAGYDLITRDMFVAADAVDFEPGPAIGSHFPGVSARWQGRDIRLLQEFAGANGTVFVAARSVSWCPFCMRQLIQLQESRADWEAAGIGLVAMTYDDADARNAFVAQWGIEYPILQDVDTLSFRTLGILNAEYAPGDMAYGIPYPGMIVIDAQGVVVGKLFVEAYSKRVDAHAALAYAREVLGLTPAQGE
ncbi:redoxin domain-containing protein [Mangrovimicrobium sediminis]|uniref:Redoxin domain-containing protein n=1 Tax=Mangrovimicrobium sediminis TaxID=2562682 RepID=A0A4Z0LYB5_9GAMM|nr:redoxin domain-containing protein [Haliea sp. SAOS-164]TGD72128.1 redoxin domain-containing protein [Haliea sp. SAOS-164]